MMFLPVQSIQRGTVGFAGRTLRSGTLRTPSPFQERKQCYTLKKSCFCGSSTPEKLEDKHQSTHHIKGAKPMLF